MNHEEFEVIRMAYKNHKKDIILYNERFYIEI